MSESKTRKYFAVVEMQLSGPADTPIHLVPVNIDHPDVVSAKIVDSSNLRPVIQYERRSLAYGTG